MSYVLWWLWRTATPTAISNLFAAMFWWTNGQNIFFIYTIRFGVDCSSICSPLLRLFFILSPSFIQIERDSVDSLHIAIVKILFIAKSQSLVMCSAVLFFLLSHHFLRLLFFILRYSFQCFLSLVPAITWCCYILCVVHVLSGPQIIYNFSKKKL